MYFVPNISMTSEEVGGTVESQNRPMTTPNRIAVAGRGRQQDEGGDRDRAAEIDPGQQTALGHARREPAGAERADGVGEPDHRERPAADPGRQAGILEIGRQVRGDEGELEAAGEEAEHQQDVAAVPEGLGQRLRDRLVRRSAPARPGAASPVARRERERERQDEQHARRRR